MTQQILIEEKSNYGRVSYYPVNKIAKTICNTYQKKTFTSTQLKDLSLAFDISLQVRNHTFELTRKEISQLN
tara:strand:- start:798 stop:1013 length:216 start_codon:yes stop_codon:yes gene_type:complete